jgi:hypothetical protein
LACLFLYSSPPRGAERQGEVGESPTIGHGANNPTLAAGSTPRDHASLPRHRPISPFLSAPEGRRGTDGLAPALCESNSRLRGERLGEVGVDGGNAECTEPSRQVQWRKENHLFLSRREAREAKPHPEPRLPRESKDAVYRFLAVERFAQGCAEGGMPSARRINSSCRLAISSSLH